MSDATDGFTRSITDVLSRQRRPVPFAKLADLVGVDETDADFQQTLVRLRKHGTVFATNGYRYAATPQNSTFTGQVRVVQRGFGFVEPEEGGEDVLIPEKHLADAIDGDHVAVQLLRRRGPGGSRSGKVLGVALRPERRVVGVVRQGAGFAILKPDDPVLPDLQLLGAQWEDCPDGHKIVAILEAITLTSTVPTAHLERVLGDPSQPGVDMAAVIFGHGLNEEFPDDVEGELEDLEDAVTEADLQGRRDLRDLTTLTIDPPDARDIDDAISLSHDSDGRPVVGVHIADVSHFVEIGGAVDREAFARGTSVYLPGRTLHMLPQKLSQNLCSLLPETDRLAVSVFVTLGEKRQSVHVDFTRSIIRSRAKLAYEQVDAVLEGNEDEDNPAAEFGGMLRALAKLTRGLTKQRAKDGALDFDVPEVKVELDDDGRVLSLSKRERLESHRLIEELMLLANREVARELGRRKVDFLYRVHAKPDPYKLREVMNLASIVGESMSMKPGKPPGLKELQQLLSRVEKTPVGPVFKMLTIRSLPKAVYQPENIGHFGLATREYTHFTSPIRRYPDLTVHRQLCASLERRQVPYELADLVMIGDAASQAERQAENAERDAIAIKQAFYLREHMGETFTGTISGVHRSGLFVTLFDTLAEGYVRAEDVANEPMRFDSTSLSLIGRASGDVHRFGDPVVVQVAGVDTDAGQIDFMLVENRASKKHRDPRVERSLRKDSSRDRRDRKGGKSGKGRGKRGGPRHSRGGQRKR